MTITYEDFAKVEIRVGTIKTCVPVEKSSKLYKLEVDFGELGVRQILTGLQQHFKAEELTGLQTFFVTNMEPRKMVGQESNGMILGVGMDHTKKPILLKPAEPAINGDQVS
jgi:methionine--tRNA ligase beta chain